MANDNSQKRHGKTDFFGMTTTSFGAEAPTTDCKYFLTKTALGLDSSIADAVKPSGTTWSAAVLTLTDQEGTEPQAYDIDVTGNTVTTLVSDANAKKFKGEIHGAMIVTASDGSTATASCYFTYGNLATSDQVKSIGNE